MKTEPPRRTIAGDPDARARTELLLDRHPDINASERDEIAHFLRKGSPLDLGLLSSNEQAWKTAERFKTENPAHFALTPREYTFWGSLAVAVAAIIFFLWDLHAT